MHFFIDSIDVVLVMKVFIIIYFGFRFLENVEQAIHSPNCPIWDVHFRPLLPPHAQTNRTAPTTQMPVIPNQQVTQNPTPSVGSTASTINAATPASAVIKQEIVETTEGEPMQVDQAYEHPSAAMGSANSRNIKQDLAPAIDSASVAIPLVTENGDLPMDLVKDMFRDLDFSQRRGDSDV